MTEKVKLDPDKCIICQKDDSKDPCTPSEAGKLSMKRAADVRNDIVSKRLKIAEESGIEYCYHNLNACFKGYVRKAKYSIIRPCLLIVMSTYIYRYGVTYW